MVKLTSWCIRKGSVVRITCDMRKDATPEMLYTLLPSLLRSSRKEMQPVKNAAPAQPVAMSSNQPAWHTASLHVSLKSGSAKNTCPKVNSVAVRRMGRKAAMTSNAEPYKGVCSHDQCNIRGCGQHIGYNYIEVTPYEKCKVGKVRSDYAILNNTSAYSAAIHAQLETHTAT